MADFKTQQKIIIEFIEKNFINYLPDEFKIFELTTDFLDFDKHKGSCILFIDFTKIGFPNSNYKDDCGNIENLSVTVYLVHRNNTAFVIKRVKFGCIFCFLQNDTRKSKFRHCSKYYY
jgi:hypothetical protein